DIEGLHHAPPIAEHIAAKGVNLLITRMPGNGPMNGGFTHTVSTIINQRLPLHFTPRGETLNLIANGRVRVALSYIKLATHPHLHLAKAPSHVPAHGCYLIRFSRPDRSQDSLH